jgi:hypothetical protein
MKHLAFLTLLALAVLSCEPQAGEQDQAPIEYGATMGAFWRDATAFTTDTLANAETFTYNIGSFNRPVSIDLQVSGDSLSGSTNVAVILEQSINGTDYAALSTTANAINGAGTSNTRITADCLGGTIRARAVGTGTQSTIVRMDALVAESQPTQ